MPVKSSKKHSRKKTANPVLPNAFGDGWKGLIKKGTDSFNLELESHHLDLMAIHAAELLKWNKKFNITSIVDPGEMATKHFIDSLAIVSHIPEPQILKNGSVLDIGSGGGFPGFPLKVVRPDLNVVMADASRKRVSFLNALVRLSGLDSVSAVHARAEDLAKDPDFAGKFDVVTSRAFTALDRFVQLARPFLSPTGIILAMKGGAGTQEAEALSLAGFSITPISYLLPLENHGRTIVVIKRC